MYEGADRDLPGLKVSVAMDVWRDESRYRSYLTQFAGKANRLGLAGLAVLFATALSLVFTIDRTLNGMFAIYQKILEPKWSPLGPWALHLTAHSNVLFEYDGGPGRVAIHGARACLTPVRTAVLCPLWFTWCSTRSSGVVAFSPCSTARVSSRE